NALCRHLIRVSLDGNGPPPAIGPHRSLSEKFALLLCSISNSRSSPIRVAYAHAIIIMRTIWPRSTRLPLASTLALPLRDGVGGQRPLRRIWDRRLSLRLFYENSDMMAAYRLDWGFAACRSPLTQIHSR